MEEREEDEERQQRNKEVEGRHCYDPSQSEEYEAFQIVKKNKDSCLNYLMSFVQTIEREWDNNDNDDEGRKRVQRLKILALCLSELKDHKSVDLRELSRLSDKMKGNFYLSQKHFLGLFLPIERKYTRGLADHQFLSVDTLDADRLATPIEGDSSEASDAMKVIEKIPLVLVLGNINIIPLYNLFLFSILSCYDSQIIISHNVSFYSIYPLLQHISV